MDYKETLSYLYASQPAFHLIGAAAYKPGFENTNKLLTALHNPHLKFKSVHVAGTNGKGSTSHLLAAVLQKAGYKTGLYTSPHLVDFAERIRINGEKVTKQYVIDFVENNKSLLEDIKPSFFETTMAMAFAYFAEQKVDIAIIEVGLGGRLDSTNVILPEISIITNIGYDHMEFLGHTLEKIATEKAGIIKPATPIVIGETQTETRSVFINKAKELNSEIVFADANSDFNNTYFQASAIEIPCELHGIYQAKNKQTAYIALQILRKKGWNISDHNILDGYKKVCTLTGLQGRWQTIQQHPTVICDTGHNSHGIKYVAAQLASYPCHTLRIVFGMVNDKDIDVVLGLLPNKAIYYFTQAATPRALSAVELQTKAAQFQLKGQWWNSVQSAYQQALSDAQTDDLVFVGGSNYVVGEMLLTLPTKQSK